jgi:MFS family permease
MAEMIRHNVAKGYAAAFLKNLQFFGPVAVPYFIDWLRVDYTRMFILQAWFLFWVFVLEIPTGIVADRFGRKMSVASGCLLFAADMLFFGFSRNYYLLFFAEFLGAVGMTLVSGAEQALFYDSLVALSLEGRARIYFSRYEAAGTFGLLVSFPIGSTVAALRNYPTLLPVTFVITAFAAVPAAVLFLWMGEPPRTKPKEGFLKMGVEGLRTLFAHRNLRAYVLNAVTISALTFFAFWFYQPVLRHAGLGIAWLGYIGAGFNLFSTLLLSNVALIEKLLGLRRLLLYSALLPAALFVALGLVHRGEFAIPAFFIIVGCKMVRMPILNEFINRQVESENRATVISSVSLLERFLMFLLYPVVGRLADASLDYALWLLGGLCAALAVTTRISDVLLAAPGAPGTARPAEHANFSSGTGTKCLL